MTCSDQVPETQSTSGGASTFLFALASASAVCEGDNTTLRSAGPTFVLMRAVFLVLCGSLSAHADVHRAVREPRGALSGEVVRSRIPSPRSMALAATSGLRIVHSNGSAVPAQFKVAGGWNAGRADATAPVQWLLGSFRWARAIVRYAPPAGWPNSFDVRCTGSRIGGTLVSLGAMSGGGDPFLYDTCRSTLAGPFALAATMDRSPDRFARDLTRFAIDASVAEGSPLGK